MISYLRSGISSNDCRVADYQRLFLFIQERMSILMLRKFCRKLGCNRLTTTGYCDNHPKQTHDRQRGSSAERGYDHKWRKERKAFLRENPLCIDCYAEGKLVSATDVDHEIPHRSNMVLFWDRTNWRARCHSHHSQKTAREDGGFGNGQ